MKRDSFVFYASFYEAIKELDINIQGEIYTAIIEYGLYGNVTENLKPIAKAMFTLIKPQLDANTKRYENGKRGGKPPKNGEDINQEQTKDEPKANQEQTKSEPNVNDNVNGNVNDNDIIHIKGEKKILKPSLLKTLNALLADQVYIEMLCMNKSTSKSILSIEDMNDYLKTFFVELESRGDDWKDEADAKKHFSIWLDIQLEKKIQKKKEYIHPAVSYQGSQSSSIVAKFKQKAK